jgi:hypothetical protein
LLMRKPVIATLLLSALLTLVARTQTPPQPRTPPKPQAQPQVQPKPQTQPPPASTLVLQTDIKREIRTKGLDGKEQVKYETFRQVKTDDILVYTLTYTNGGNKDDSSGIMYKIMPDSVFVDASGDNATVEVSANGGKNWALHPARYRSKGPDGKIVEKPVPLDRITNVRWVFKQPIKPGQSGQVKLKIRVK